MIDTKLRNSNLYKKREKMIMDTKLNNSEAPHSRRHLQGRPLGSGARSSLLFPLSPYVEKRDPCLQQALHARQLVVLGALTQPITDQDLRGWGWGLGAGASEAKHN